MAEAQGGKPGWAAVLRAMGQRKTGYMALFGFASGLPFRAVSRHALRLAVRGRGQSGNHGRVLADRSVLCLPVPVVAR